MNPLVQTLTAEEVTLTLQQPEEDRKSSVINSLSEYVDKLWSDAKDFKASVEDDMLELKRQRNGEYSPEKLAEIRSAEQPEIFLNITDTKCRNAIAWIKDILMTGDRIFSVAPTPLPELPQEITAKIQQSVLQQFVQSVVQEAMATGQMIDENILRQLIIDESEEIKNKVKKQIVKYANDLADDIAYKVDDDWIEGGFYKALEECIDDLISLKACII